MLFNKKQGFVLLLILLGSLVTNIKPVIATPTKPVNTKSVKGSNKRKNENEEVSLSVEEIMISKTGEKTIGTVTKPISNSSINKKTGNYISSNYNTVSIRQTDNNLQTIAYLGMNNVSAEQTSNALLKN